MEGVAKYFQVLGLSEKASLQEVKESYKDLVNVWHPDRFGYDVKLQEKAGKKLQEINAAYEMIKEFFATLYFQISGYQIVFVIPGLKADFG